MARIVLSRIDDRLIHGQVMTAWVAHVGGTEILIVDDKVAGDSFLSSVITAAVPKNLKASAITISDALARLSVPESDDGAKLILLAKGPEVYRDLLRGGVPIASVNVGGMGSKQGREKLYRNIAASSEERSALKELEDEGVDVFIQVVPNSERVELSKVL